MELGSAEAFDRSGTLGIEEEFYVVDADGRPTGGTDELVYETEPPAILDGRLDHELFTCVIETQTPVIDSFDRAPAVLADVRSALVAHAEAHGYQIAAAGLHPAAKWRELEHVTKPRYKSQLDRIQYPQHRNTTAGLHIHVGVDDADKATWVANELRIHLPLVLALSANSPYWCGLDTGLESARAKIFEALPNTGMPTPFDSFAEYAAFEEWMVESGSIRDRGELWYDVRPHSAHGTVEVRTPDAQASEDRVIAFVEYVDALVRDLGARYEDGAPTTEMRREYLDESKWRAMRDGHEAHLITADRETVSVAELVDRECDRLDISGIRRVFEAGSGATHQRRRRAADGLDGLCASLLL